MTIAELFEQSIAWEIEARDHYLVFADAFPDHPTVQGFWRLMAHDESAHAVLLGEAMRSTPSLRLGEHLTESELGHVAAVENEFAVARTTKPRTLEDAYSVAHDLESSEVNALFEMLMIAPLDDGHRKSLLSSQFDEHISRLERFSREHPRAVRRRIRFQG